CSSVIPQRRSTSPQVTLRSSHNLRSRGKTPLTSSSRSACMSWKVDETKTRIVLSAGCTLVPSLCHVLRVGGGGCILRAPGGPVNLDRHAARGGPPVDQVKRGVRAGVGEQPRALADDHGVGEQGDLVDKLVEIGRASCRERLG